MLKIKLLHLNIEGGRFLDKVVDFVKKNDFDILNFQETNSGKLSKNGVNCFEYLRKALNYNGELAIEWSTKNDKNSYFGNATFFKKSLNVKNKQTIFLIPYREIPDFKKRIVQHDPKNILSLLFNFEGKDIYIVNCHLSWNIDSKDDEFRLRKNRKLYEYIKSLNNPFVLSGDFNLDPGSKVVAWMRELGRDLISENNITNTLNPRIHKAREIFPKGITVDYVFVEKSIKVSKFELIDELDLSDHFGLSIELEL